MARRYYNGRLGKFKYDNTEFKLMDGCLRYIGTETDGSKIKIPEGILDCSCMFKNCNIVTPPVIPAGVTNCHSMFYYCQSLKEPPVIPEGVVHCYGMFYQCVSLCKAPVIPDSVTSGNYMFYKCSSLTDASDISVKIPFCSMMFQDCENLIKPPVLSEGIITATYMFARCRALKEISSIPESIGDCQFMFSGCFSLKYVGKTSMSDSCGSSYIFSRCGQLYNYSLVHTGDSYNEPYSHCTTILQEISGFVHKFKERTRFNG